jgi:hypothetical protein
MKIIYLDEAVFTFKTFVSKAWSAAYQSIEIFDSKLKIRA